MFPKSTEGYSDWGAAPVQKPITKSSSRFAAKSMKRFSKKRIESMHDLYSSSSIGENQRSSKTDLHRPQHRSIVVNKRNTSFTERLRDQINNKAENSLLGSDYLETVSVNAIEPEPEMSTSAI